MLKAAVVAGLVIFCLLAAACTGSGSNAISEINENTNLPFQLTLAADDLEYGEEFVRHEGFGCYTLAKDGLLVWVSGWPDVVGEFHVTEYRFTVEEYNVFNISVDNTFDNASAVLREHGYASDGNQEAGQRRYIFRKNNQAQIILQIDADGNIYEIWVTAIATNKQNVVF